MLDALTVTPENIIILCGKLQTRVLLLLSSWPLAASTLPAGLVYCA